MENEIKEIEKENIRLIKRLNVIEGQVRGLKQMIENDRNYMDTLIQICAVNKSLKSIGHTLLHNHLSHNIENDVEKDKDKAVEDIINSFIVLNK